MTEKRFFLPNLLKTHFSFTFAISQNSKRALFVQNHPPKTEEIDVFKYSRQYGIYSKETLMQVIYSFVIINLNKNEHFLRNRIILVTKVLLPANTYCKIYMKNWNKFNRISNKNVTNFIKQIFMQ